MLEEPKTAGPSRPGVPDLRAPRIRRSVAVLAAITLIAAALIAGCGGSGSSGSSSADSLLKQTFSGTHTVNSGVLDFDLTVNPKGSSLLSGPVQIAFGGPFQDRGTGKLPASDFTISISAESLHGSLSIISTGTHGYVTMSGQSYELPQKSFRQLESGFSAAESSAGGSSSSQNKSSSLQKLGISPLHWLSDPTIAGTQTVGGVQTTHVRAKVDVHALLSDLNTLAAHSNVSVSGAGKLPNSITPAQQAKIAHEIGSPTFDLWTGSSDKTVRRMTLGMNLPVTGKTRTSLGGMTSAGVALTLQYSDLNRPQTITAPTNLKPYAVFQQKIGSLLQTIESGLALGASGSGSSGSSTTTTGTSSLPSTGNSTIDKKYGDCIAKAGGNVTKMQRCSSLLGG